MESVTHQPSTHEKETVMSMNDDDRHEDFMPTGDSTHVVNQVIKDSGQTYRFRVGEARVEGRLTGRVLLMTVLGDFEVVERQETNPLLKRLQRPHTRTQKNLQPQTGA